MTTDLQTSLQGVVKEATLILLKKYIDLEWNCCNCECPNEIPFDIEGLAGEIADITIGMLKKSDPLWGRRTLGKFRCPNCGNEDIHRSASADDPDEILGEVVRCSDCGLIADPYDAQIAYRKCWWRRIFR